jgi:RNA ligase (TIGR02306 family)
MSNFEVKIQKIFIKPHPKADRLELGNIGSPDGWQVVVKKGQFQTGDLVAYIGENSVVPEWLLRKCGLWDERRGVGTLAGPRGDRVKAIKLHEELSLGVCVPVLRSSSRRLSVPNGVIALNNGHKMLVVEGANVASELGVTKYEAPIPTCLAGEIYNAGTRIGVNYDIENIKSWPGVIVDADEVFVTEKIHGVQIQIVVLPNILTTDASEHRLVTLPDKTSAFVAVSSKGQASKGLFLKHDEANANNVYMRAMNRYVEDIVAGLKDVQSPVTILGEVYGSGVQDLTYGLSDGEIALRVFDVYVGYRGQGRYLNPPELADICERLKVEMVPTLYRGKFLMDEVARLVDGKTTLSGDNIREGVVIRPAVERRHPALGRVILKWVSEDYLTRKNGTEYN